MNLETIEYVGGLIKSDVILICVEAIFLVIF